MSLVSLESSLVLLMVEIGFWLLEGVDRYTLYIYEVKTGVNNTGKNCTIE